VFYPHILRIYTPKRAMCLYFHVGGFHTFPTDFVLGRLNGTPEYWYCAAYLRRLGHRRDFYYNLIVGACTIPWCSVALPKAKGHQRSREANTWDKRCRGNFIFSCNHHRISLVLLCVRYNDQFHVTCAIRRRERMDAYYLNYESRLSRCVYCILDLRSSRWPWHLT
jgi:hypothetical protein